MQKSNKVYLLDILGSVEKIEEYAEGILFEDFLKGGMVLDAVIRNLEIIGEAANRLSTGFVSKYPKFPLAEAIGMRNILIHNYDEVDIKVVWDTIKESLPNLKCEIEKIIDSVE